MRRALTTFGLVSVMALVAACESDAERGVAGAAGGALISRAVGGDVLTGAIIGGAAGVFCDDAGVCN